MALNSNKIQSPAAECNNDVNSLLQYVLKINPYASSSSNKTQVDESESPLNCHTRRNSNYVIPLRSKAELKWTPGRLKAVAENYPTIKSDGKNSMSFLSLGNVDSTNNEMAKVSETVNKEYQNDFSVFQKHNPPEPKRFKFQEKSTKGPTGFLPPRRIEPNLGQFSAQQRANVGGKGNPNVTTRFTSNLDFNRDNSQCNRSNATGRNFNAVNSNSDLSGDTGKKFDGNPVQNPFKTAYEQLAIEDRAKGIKRNLSSSGTGTVHVPGLLRRPARNENNASSSNTTEKKSDDVSENPEVDEIMKHDCMKNVDPKMVEAILNEVVEVAQTKWEDIAGLEGVKNIIKEIIIWPMLRPDIFTGLRGPPKGILLFGPPGTGKTMIGRLISTQSNSTFFNISASSLTSKWIGDGEKMVRALFQVARVKQPAVIFIDEIDSILTQRSDTEHESSRRLKTEFLIQFDGCGTKSDDRILVIGVTNRPQELDEAARRRLVKRIYIPLPDTAGRQQLVKNLLKDQQYSLSDEDFEEISNLTEGYSGADIRSICQEAAYGPIRDVGHMLQDITAETVRPMQLKDFKYALKHVKASVATSDLTVYEDWDDKFGCHVSKSP